MSVSLDEIVPVCGHLNTIYLNSVHGAGIPIKCTFNQIGYMFAL